MHRADDIDWVLLARYLAGECTPEQRAVVERWAASSPERGEELNLLRESWDSSAAIPSTSRVDTMWAGLSHRMRSVESANGTAGKISADASPSLAKESQLTVLPRQSWRRFSATAVAALAAGIVILAVGLFVARSGGKTSTVTPIAEASVFSTARGQHTTIRLSDGTRVELGYASTLRVGSFEGGRRQLELEGEAVFDVTHDARRPFIVRAGNVETEDLGTTFSVSAYRRDSSVRVLVVSGKVAVRPLVDSVPTTEPVVLGANQLALVTSNRLQVVNRVDTRPHLAWLTGHVAFDMVRIDEVAAQLERRFDVTIRVSDTTVAARRVYLKEMPASTLDDVLGAITVPYGLHYRREGSAIIVER